MAKSVKITAPVKDFTGLAAGVKFEDGVAETSDKNAIAYFRRKGYGIGSSTPRKASATETVEPADPRKVSTDRIGTPVRDAAVDPRKRDFLAPTNAGKANPHGPDVVAPGIHGNQGVRPVKGGDVHVDDPAKQDGAETEHTERVAVAGEPLPEVDPSAYGEDSKPIPPAGNASTEAWQEYAKAQGATEEDLDGKTRDELRDTYGPKAEA